MGDDLTLVVAAGDEYTPMRNTNKYLKGINDTTRAKIASRGVVIMTFILEVVKRLPIKTITYLGVGIDESKCFGVHAAMATNKTRSLYNDSPTSSKLLVVSSELHSIMLYVARF